MSVAISIAAMREEHWDAVRAIYLEGIATGNATFQESAPEWDAWDEAHLNAARIVALDENGLVAGWAALSPVSRRPVYAGVAEVSVYVAEAARGQGVGKRLMYKLIARSEAAGIWTLQAGIFPENLASLALHRAAGFREVGVRCKLGCLRGVWRDVLLMERRSATVGMTA
jgi:L-amino acid N-acyltransferase YncA